MVPVRRGAARRLGLRPPPSPQMLVDFPDDITAEEFEEFKTRWRETYARQQAHHVELIAAWQPATAKAWRQAERQDCRWRRPWWRWWLP